jgi:hypothetical protein
MRSMSLAVVVVATSLLACGPVSGQDGEQGTVGSTTTHTGSGIDGPTPTLTSGSVETTTRTDASETGTGASSVTITSGGAETTTSWHATDATTFDRTTTTEGDVDGSSSTGTKPGPCCPLEDLPSTEVVGKTPFGPFTGNYAWYGNSGGECIGSIRIVVTETVAQFEENTISQGYAPFATYESFRISLSQSNWDGAWVGEGPALFLIYDEAGEFESVPGTVTIEQGEPYPSCWDADDPTPPPAVLSFDLHHKQWKIAGHVQASWCSQLFFACP